MIRGTKVIAFTPAGRTRHMEILAKYVADQVERGVVDEWVLFENAFDRNDRVTIYKLRTQYPFIRIYEDQGHFDTFHIHAYYKQFTDSQAVYVRLDDDMVYLAPDSIEKLVEYRLEHPEPFLVYPAIVGNTRMGYHMQQAGIIPMEWGVLDDQILTGYAFSDSTYIRNLHELALAKIEDGIFEKDFALPDINLDSIEHGHISINCFAILGADMIALKDVIVPDEERYLSEYRPAEVGRLNAICGSAVVIHYAYHTQREELDKTDILSRYEALANTL